MRIAVLVYGLERIGGIKKHALCLSREYVSLGHKVDVWCVEYDPRNCYPNLIDGFDVHALRPASNLNIDSEPKGFGWGMSSYLKTLWKYYRDQLELSAHIPDGYDVIHPHGNMISWAAADYRHRHGTPVVWLCNDFIPVASYLGNVPNNLWEKMKVGLKKSLCASISAFDRAAVRSLDRIAVLRNLVQAQMKDYYGVDTNVIRAGVDAQAFAAGNGQRIRIRYQVPKKAFLLLSVCSLMPHRRLEDIIRAIHHLAREGEDVAYLIVGRTNQDPGYSRRIEQEIQGLGLCEHVKLVGEIYEEELVDCYHACDAFVWASDENQSWGLAGMEAMAAGKPVIVSQASGLAEVLTDEKNALLVMPRSPMLIADAVKKLLSNPVRASAIGREGQRLVREEYSWHRNAVEMLLLFEEARKDANRRLKVRDD